MSDKAYKLLLQSLKIEIARSCVPDEVMEDASNSAYFDPTFEAGVDYGANYAYKRVLTLIDEILKD